MKGRPHPLLAFALVVRDLCQFRRGPADMPYSPALLGVLIAASVLFDVAAGAVIGATGNVLLRSVVSTALVLALCWVALAIRHLASRYVQTASALVACSIVFSLLILPLAASLAGTLPETATALTPGQTLIGWGMLAIFVWSIAVTANIVRHALDAPFIFGLALASTWALADWAIGHALFDVAH